MPADDNASRLSGIRSGATALILAAVVSGCTHPSPSPSPELLPIGESLPVQAQEPRTNAVHVAVIGSSDQMLLAHFENVANAIGGELSFGGGVSYDVAIDEGHLDLWNERLHSPPFGAPGSAITKLALVDENSAHGKTSALSEITGQPEISPAVATALRSRCFADACDMAEAGEVTYEIAWRAVLMCDSRGQTALGYYIDVNLKREEERFEGSFEAWEGGTRVAMISGFSESGRAR